MNSYNEIVTGFWSLDAVLKYLNKSIPKIDTIPEVVCASEVAIERPRIELGHHIDLVYSAINAVAHGNVDEPIASTDGNLHSKKIMKQSREGNCSKNTVFMITGGHRLIFHC